MSHDRTGAAPAPTPSLSELDPELTLLETDQQSSRAPHSLVVEP